MHIDWDHDDRPTWEVTVDFFADCAWDHLDRVRLADEIEGTGLARRAAVSTTAMPLGLTARLRVKAENPGRAATAGVTATEIAAARLGIPLKAVTCRSAVAQPIVPARSDGRSTAHQRQI